MSELALAKFVAVEGVIAAGKTTTVGLLAERLGARPVYERSEDNSFLDSFGANPSSCELEVEIEFLLLHHFDLKHLDPAVLHISDYSLEKDLVFAHANLEGENFDLFNNLYSGLYPRTPSPRVTLFLNVDPECLMRRMKARNRANEMCFPLDYLRRLQDAYMELMPRLWPDCIELNVSGDEAPEDVAHRAFELLAPRLSEL